MKILLPTLAAALLITAQPATAELQVFACEPEWASLAAELAPHAKIYSATTVYQDPHHIEARPGLIAKLRKADLLICSGASLEAGWLPVLLRQSANPDVQPGKPGHLLAAMQVKRLDIPTSVDRSMGDVHSEGNPHVHLDPRRVNTIANVIVERLKLIDPDNSAAYIESHATFSQRWGTAMERWQRQAEPLRGEKLVTHHKEWTYLDDFLGTTSIATLEPKPGIPTSLGYLSKLQASLKGEQVLAIIRKPSDPSKASKWLAGRLNRPQLELPYSVDKHTAKDLFELFDKTITLLLNAKLSSD